MSDRDRFLQRVRQALGRTSATDEVVPEVTALADGPSSVEQRADAVLSEATANSEDLMSQLESSAGQAGWNVARFQSAAEAGTHIAGVARNLEARSLVRSTHEILDRLQVEALLSGTGIEMGLMAADGAADEAGREAQRRRLRERAIQADLGITGVDYAIAETGTCVILPRKGVSRLVSLLPPAYVAVVQAGQVLPSLDELFTLQRRDFIQGDLRSYMSLITGPSRSADIEYTLVTGVHGPGDVHLVLIG